MAKILVEQELVEVATTAIEQAKIYIDGLRKIAFSDIQSADELKEIAKETMKYAQTIGVLSQNRFED